MERLDLNYIEPAEAGQLVSTGGRPFRIAAASKLRRIAVHFLLLDP